MKRAAFLLLGLLFAATLRAQNPPTGFPPYGSFQAGGFDAVNRQDLDVNFAIPVVSSPGRGMDFKLTIVYDSLLWTLSGGAWTPVVDQSGNPTWGWKKDIPGGRITYIVTTNQFKCFPPDGSPWYWTTRTYYTNYVYTDVLGTAHPFGVNPIDDSNCSGGLLGTLTGNALDGSGYYMDATTPTSPVATSPGGIKSPSGSVSDTNGNLLTKNVVSSTETD